MHRTPFTIIPVSFMLAKREDKNMRRNFERYVSEGEKKLSSHPCYGLMSDECLPGFLNFFSDGKLLPINGSEIMRTLVTYYSAGVAAGYRMAENDRKRKRESRKG